MRVTMSDLTSYQSLAHYEAIIARNVSIALRQIPIGNSDTSVSAHAAAEPLDPRAAVGPGAGVAAAAAETTHGRGGLIHAAAGTTGGAGRPRTKRSGWAA